MQQTRWFWLFSGLFFWLTFIACPNVPLPPDGAAEAISDSATERQTLDTPDTTTADTSPRPDKASPDVAQESTPPDATPELSTPDGNVDALPERTAPPEPRPEALPEATPEPLPDGPLARSRCTSGTPGKYLFGKVYWGRKSYIQYIPGNLPLVFSSPHGGAIKPSEIPDRTMGTTVGDSNSLETTLETAHVLYKATGRYPHIILNRLHRIRLDANREIKEAAQANQWAEQAWREFHTYIDAAKATVTQRCQRGHYFDFHTNAHSSAWTEFGVLLTSANLKQNDATLRGNAYRDRSSLKALVTWSGTPLPILVRGPMSLGTLLMKGGYKAVPSGTHPDPGSGSYFSGGYNTVRHGSRDGGTIDGTQIETYTSFSRNSRSDYAAKVAVAILDFVQTHYGFSLRNPAWKAPAHSLCTGAKVLAFDAKGEIAHEGTTLGASDAFVGQITCGRGFAMAGPQTYYKLSLEAGRSYEISFTPSFASRLYLFGDTCDPKQIEVQCKAAPLSGQLVATNTTYKATIKASRTGIHTLAIDSRNPAWYGHFSLSLVRK